MLRMYVHRYAVDVMHLINVAFTFFEIEHACICKCRSNTCILYYIGCWMGLFYARFNHKATETNTQKTTTTTRSQIHKHIQRIDSVVNFDIRQASFTFNKRNLWNIVFYVCSATRHASKMQLNRSKTTITTERPQQKEAGNMIEIVWK